MPKGPKGQKRPGDVIGAAVKVMKIATGEEPEDYGTDDGKDKAAQSLGERGGKARAKALTPERRAQIARKAAKKRWKHRLMSLEAQSQKRPPPSTACAPTFVPHAVR